jgi:hypothetical protein
LAQLLWGRVEDGKDDEKVFKLIHTDLEFDYNNLPEKDMISYYDFIERKYKLKNKTEIPDEKYRQSTNNELTYI